ncbi:MAG TPA: hypothetical protein VFX51_14860 [Solirubrobacteraceae bacterium]|nr:hypothetical protein [Solirubrobacteraceae bacterium]
MHQRVRETNPARLHAAEAALTEPELLALQRTAGNQAVVRMLARDKTPSRLDVGPVTELYKGGTDAEAWGDAVRSRKHFVDLYSELATLLNATKIEDVKGTSATDINTARKPEGSALKQGLNFVGELDDRGQGGYLYDGKFNMTLPDERDGALPTVAVLLGPHAFDAANKASTVGVLRHELEHAFHNRLALNWLKTWREDAKADKTAFLTWLKKKKLPAADLALVRERVGGTRINTEALGNLEQFITQLPFEGADADKLAHGAYPELEDAAGYWVDSDPAVQAEIVARLKALRGRLNKDRQAAFDAAMEKLKAGNKAYAPLADAAVK